MPHTSEISKDQPNIASVLSASYHFMMGRIVEDLAGAGYKDLSKLQLHILSRMETETVSIKDLSRRVGIAKQILDNLVSMLAENGYVHTEEETVSLAERGREAMHCRCCTAKSGSRMSRFAWGHRIRRIAHPTQQPVPRHH